MISIITVTYNAVATFERTIQSVACQGIHTEFIVIDGGSTDGTIEVAERNRELIDIFISEPDNGIFDAMNKGVDRATGEWLFFLGADDQLASGILKKIMPCLQPNLAVVYGDVLYSTGGIMRSKIGIRCLLENRLHHQGAFYNKNLFNKFRYNQKFTGTADYELTLRIYLQKEPYLYVPYIISIFAAGGYSSQGGLRRGIMQVNSIRSLYVHNKILNTFLSIVLNTYHPFMNRREIIIKKLRKIFK